MQSDRASLASLIGSRICHDLINPIGAISNGLELVGMGGASPVGPELSLIQQSCDNATARIRFFRIAFGSAGDVRPMPSAEARKTLADHFAGTRYQTDWQIVGDTGRDVVQLAYLTVLCLESALPRGGALTVNLDGTVITVAAQADEVRADMALWEILNPDAAGSIAEIRPADVQFALLSQLCQDRGIVPTLSKAPGQARMTLALPGANV